jgi:hypothetical protein
MAYVAESDREAVKRPDAEFLVFETTPYMGGNPAGLMQQWVGDRSGVHGYLPTIEDILANDWEVYVPAPALSR